MENDNKKRNYKLILSIAVTILVLAGSTYAVWYYWTEKTRMIVTIDGHSINLNAGQNITASNMFPVYSHTEGIVKTIEVYETNANYTGGINFFLDLTTMPVEPHDKSLRWMLYKNGSYLTSGDFWRKKQGDTIVLNTVAQKVNTEANKDTYTLYIWIDANQETNINLINQTFSFNLYAQSNYYDGVEEPVANDVTPNAPDLIDGMIPVKYDYMTDNWVKADSTNTNNDWYNYNAKIWANAVLVTTDTRTTYMNASVNTPVSEDDILAYYVWIPRYKYLLFNVNSEAMNPREIKIEFQSKNDTIASGTQNGQWLTHPAFWWDDDSDGVRDAGEELSGIWVGKFETGGTSTNPLIKPNINSILTVNNNNRRTFFTINRIFGTSDYLTATGVSESDSHVMKNMEWGVVAYLSHSKYGTNTEICINNSSGNFTGRSGGNVGGSTNTIKIQYSNLSSSTNIYSNKGYYTYNDYVVDYDGNYDLAKDIGLGVCASTTGNVFGIYDMSGGASDQVMGVQKSSSGAVYYDASGFNANTIPASKYYDLYDYGSNKSEYVRRKLGDATGETRAWYADRIDIVTSSGGGGWFSRGIGASSSISAGIFAATAGAEGNNIYGGFRSVIIKP